MDRLEKGGYEAGLAGKELEQSSTWGDAWQGAPGSNAPARVVAGWVAGRVLRRLEGDFIPRDLLRRYMAIVYIEQGVTFWNRSRYRRLFTPDEKDLLSIIELEAQAQSLNIAELLDE